MYFIRINDEYINYLKQQEGRVPNQDYGEHKYKPFYILSTLDSSSDVLYVTQITSPKERHHRLNENTDFFKLRKTNGKLIGATNLNYMFPVLPEHIEHLSFNDLKDLVLEDYKVDRLRDYKRILDKVDLKKKFDSLYRLRYENPTHPISRRCLDFKQLEAKMLEFKLQEQFYNKDIKVERSNDYSTFFVATKNEKYEYSENILDDIYGFLNDISQILQDEEELQIENELTI